MKDWKTNALWMVSCALLTYVSLFRGVADAGAREAVKAGAKLVDVRTPQEFASGHLDGAINIPLQEMDARMAEFGPKDGVVVVYCRSGARSAKAKSRLEAAGYKTVHNLGAMSNW